MDSWWPTSDGGRVDRAAVRAIYPLERFHGTRTGSPSPPAIWDVIVDCYGPSPFSPAIGPFPSAEAAQAWIDHEYPARPLWSPDTPEPPPPRDPTTPARRL